MGWVDADDDGVGVFCNGEASGEGDCGEISG